MNTETLNDWRARRKVIEARFAFVTVALCIVMGWLTIYMVIDQALRAIASVWAPL